MPGPSPRPSSDVPGTPDEDGADLDDALLGDLVDPLPEEGSDDERSPFGTELEIDEPPALSADDGIEIDAGDPLDEVPLLPEGASIDADVDGPEFSEGHAEFEGLTPLELEDLPDGPDEPLPNLELPDLDAEPGDAPVGSDTPHELEATLLLGDEPRPKARAVLFREVAAALQLEACGALTVAEGTVLAASTDLLWFARGELSPLRLEAGSTRIHDVVLIGADREYALCSTTSGRLFRRGRSISTPEELRAPRAEPASAQGGRVTNSEALDLFQASSAASHTVIARTAAGQLFCSDDDGASFHRLPAPVVRALSHSGGLLTALGERGLLLRSHDGGRSFEELSLHGFEQQLASNRAPLVAGAGEVVVLGAEALGIAVSADGGRSFRRIVGSRGVTALTVATTAFGAHVFAALESSALNESALIEIVPGEDEAATVALIGSPDGDDDTAERVRVARLAWDADHGRLWVAGAFGVKVFTPS